MNNSKDTVALLGGIGLGAAAMYMLDPDRGRRRRAIFVDKLAGTLHELGDAVEVTGRDLLNRSRGAVAELWGALRRDHAPDAVLVQRVRSKLGRVTSHPAAIDAIAENGVVTLRGPILEAELDRVISGVASVRGVMNVRNELEVHKTPENIPDLQGGSGRTGERFELMQTNWAPATRMLSGTAGALLATSGFKRRNVPGALLGIFGTALLLRGVSNMELARMIGRRGRRAIDLQKTVHVNAPVEEVYQFWRKLENFPRFMAHVYSVEAIDEGRHRWTVSGPGGLPVSWNSTITVDIPNKVIGWRSEPGSVVHNGGIVRFDSENGGTRAHIRMTYNPPGGAIGHAIALLFGADPTHAMHDDLARFKSLIEIGKTRAHGNRVTREELAG